MEFLYPWFLWLLFPITVLFLKRRRGLSLNLKYLALIFLILAISRPAIRGSLVKKELDAHSIILALDISASMRAEDIKPNREIASKDTIREFLQIDKIDQIALIGFTSNPLLLSPPTTDHNLISIALDTLIDEYILTKGTDIKKLIKKVSKFSDKRIYLVIFSDGGDEVIDDELISMVESRGVEILAIAMATEEGSPIKLDRNTLLKDKNGHIVISKFNSELEKIAKVVKFTNSKDVAETILDWIESQSSKEKIKYQTYNYFELYFIPTILALILLFFSSTRFLLNLIALLSIFGVNLQAYSLFDNIYLNRAYSSYISNDYNSSIEILSKIESDSLEKELILANSYYKIREYKIAKEILKSIKTTNPKIKQQILYNLGNCEANLAYYNRAKEYYIKALAFGEDKDIIYNLNRVIFLQQKYKSKLGVTNLSSKENSSTSSNNNTKTEDKPSSKNSDKVGSSGGGGSKVSKNSTTKEIKSSSKNSSKRVMSSKAYDLINRGYIKESRPW